MKVRKLEHILRFFQQLAVDIMYYRNETTPGLSGFFAKRVCRVIAEFVTLRIVMWSLIKEC